MELGCSQTRGPATPGIGFGGLAYLGYAGSVGFSIGPGRCPSRKIDAYSSVPRVLGLELLNQGTAKASSAHSVRKSIGSTKVVAPQVSIPLFQKILLGRGLEAYVGRKVEMERKKILSAHFCIFSPLNIIGEW